MNQDAAVKHFQLSMCSPVGLNFRTDEDYLHLRRTAELQLALLKEEFSETIVALERIISKLSCRQNPTRDDLRELLDGLADSKYVISHCGNAFSISTDAAFKRVHESNMSKIRDDGTVIRREDGKILKPDTYHPPHLDDLIP